MLSRPCANAARRCARPARRAPATRLAGRGAERLVVGEHAHLLVGDLAGVTRADRALGVAVDLDLGEGGAEGGLNRYVNVYLNDEDVRVLEGLETAVGDTDTLVILPAMAGGASQS